MNEMDAIELDRRCDRELLHARHLDNLHGITLENISHRRVSPPRSTRCDNAGCPTGPPEIDAWVVLDEYPDSGSAGYLVVFDPSSDMYGSAIKSTPLPVFIGRYGSLVDTLNAM